MNTHISIQWLCPVVFGFCLNASATFVQQAKLTNPDAGVTENFGVSMSISANGNNLIVGADGSGRDVYEEGAYVFSPFGTVRLIPSAGLYGNGFGGSVSLSSDGNTAVVGAGNTTVEGNDGQGVAYVFTRSGSDWSQQKTLIASDGANSVGFGASVGISSDGDTIIIAGQVFNADRTEHQGCAYVFTRNGTHWSQQAKLVVMNDSSVWYGLSIGISDNGNTVVLGAAYGEVYVFARSGDSWSQQTKLGSTGRSSSFAEAGISGDGNTVVASVSDVGAYVYTRTGSVWSQQAKLAATDGAEVGSSAAISSDGHAIIVGATGATVGGNNNQGAAYVFARTGSSWTQYAKLVASDGAPYIYFGGRVAISGDGAVVVVGSGVADQRSEYVFVNIQIQQNLVQFQTPAYSVSKACRNVTVTVTRSNVVSGATSVRYATTNGTALAGTDYVATTGTVSWASWSADNKTITIPIINRAGTNASRAFGVNLLDDSGAVIGTTTVTITDSTPVPTPPVGVTASYDTYIDRIRIGGTATAESTGYEVWRGTSADTNNAVRITTTTGAYDDMSATEGVPYYYWLKATNATGTSAFSAPVLGRVLVGPDVRVNGSAGPLSVASGSELAVTVSMNPADYEGVPADWWVLAVAPSGLYYLNSSMVWTVASSTTDCHPVCQGALAGLQSRLVLDTATLPVGSYTFYFGIDHLNGVIDPDIIYDSAVVTVAQ